MKTKKYKMIFASFTRAEKLKKILEDLNIKYEYSPYGLLSYIYEFKTTKDNFKKICEDLAINKTDLIISYRE